MNRTITASLAGIMLAGTTDGCSSDINGADPSEELEAFALSLDKTDQAPMDLGAAFAEWVTIKCS